MTTVGKVALAGTTLGTIGGGGIIANSFLNIPDKSTKAKLIKEGFDLNIDTKGWETILATYNPLKDTTKTFKSGVDDVETPEGLKKKCENFWKQENISEIDYKKVKQWCVKEETINVILDRAKYRSLSINIATNDDNSEWIEKISNLKRNQNSFPTVGQQMGNTENTNITTIKKGCKNLNSETIKTTTDGFNEKFEQSKSWCFVKKNGN